MFIKKIILAILCVMMITSVNLYAEETWKITSLDWQPYSGAEMTSQGNSVQKLRNMLEKEGIKLVVEFYPWKRAMAKAETKEYVGYFPAWPEEVVEGFVASAPVDWSEVGVLKQTGGAVSFETVDELFKTYTVGIVKTYTYPKVVTDAMKKYPKNVKTSQNEISLLKMLSAGRFSAAITDPSVMLYLAQKEGVANVVSANRTIEKKELVIAIRNDKDNKSRIDLLNKMLKGK